MASPETKSDKHARALRALRDTPAPHADADAEVLAASHGADPQAERLAYSVAEAALLTGLSCDLLYDQMRTGKLAFLKVGRRRIITRQNLESFLARPAS